MIAEITIDKVKQSALVALKKALDDGDADMTHAATIAVRFLEEELPRQ